MTLTVRPILNFDTSAPTIILSCSPYMGRTESKSSSDFLNFLDLHESVSRHQATVAAFALPPDVLLRLFGLPLAVLPYGLVSGVYHEQPALRCSACRFVHLPNQAGADFPCARH